MLKKELNIMIKDATEMSLEEFMKKYFQLVGGGDDIRKIYAELRKKAEFSKTDDDHIAGNKE